MERSRSCSEKIISSSSSNTPAAAASATGGTRCYSASYVTPKNAANGTAVPSSPSPASGGSKASMWSGIPATAEMRRRRRVAGYRVYAVEGRVKGSVKSGVRWLKSKCGHGWW